MSAPDCAAAIVAQLCAQRVRDVVLSPGSRSAPLALALASAESQGMLRVHVRTDERSGGFLALGLAKASGVPSVVVTTSGTAVGNLLPAVMEAHHAGVPVIVLSADRPAAQVGFGSNQTTDQSRLFEPFVRWSARVSSSAPASSWTAQAARAWLLAAGLGSRHPGPVHLNVELAEPLAGAQPAFPAVREVLQAPPGPADPVVLASGPRTLLVCGDASPSLGAQVAGSAKDSGLPLVAEPSSNARAAALRTGRLLLGGPLADEVERVVVFGHPTLSRPVNRLLARDDVELVVVSATADWVDPGWRATQIASAVELPTAEAGWTQRWQAADDRVAAALEELVARQEMLTGPAVAAAVARSVGNGVLVLGNSQPIRDADLAPLKFPQVYANRGLAGIDGTVSTAAGIALALGRPVTLLCGDLTFLHDGNGLAAGLGEERPDLRIVVADDNGGSIFSTLEYGDVAFAGAFERVFATPTGVDAALLAVAHGIPSERVGSADELAGALARPIAGVEVIVAGIDRAGRRTLDQAVNALR